MGLSSWDSVRRGCQQVSRVPTAVRGRGRGQQGPRDRCPGRGGQERHLLRGSAGAADPARPLHRMEVQDIPGGCPGVPGQLRVALPPDSGGVGCLGQGLEGKAKAVR